MIIGHLHQPVKSVQLSEGLIGKGSVGCRDRIANTAQREWGWWLLKDVLVGRGCSQPTASVGLRFAQSPFVAGAPAPFGSRQLNTAE